VGVFGSLGSIYWKAKGMMEIGEEEREREREIENKEKKR
jgi:hypothetical protein